MPQGRKNPTGPQIWRFQKILELLRAGSTVNARRVAEAFEVSKRTIAGDISYLRAIGVPLHYDHKKRTYQLTEDFDNLPIAALKRTDLATFLVARYALEALGDTPHAELLSEIVLRLSRHLPDTVHVEPDTLSRTIRFESGPRPPRAPITLTVFEQAAQEQRVVHLIYHSNHRDERTLREVEPYAVLCYQGRWYLIAYCRLRQAMRDFRIDRIHQCEVLEETFVRDPSFDLSAYLDPAFGMHRGDRTYAVRIRFSAYQARWIQEEKWHESQVMIRLPDGRLEVMFQATGLTDLTRWVLSYGAECEVKSPPVLKLRVAAEARRMATLYANVPSTKCQNK